MNNGEGGGGRGGDQDDGGVGFGGCPSARVCSTAGEFCFGGRRLVSTIVGGGLRDWWRWEMRCFKVPRWQPLFCEETGVSGYLTRKGRRQWGYDNGARDQRKNKGKAGAGNGGKTVEKNTNG